MTEEHEKRERMVFAKFEDKPLEIWTNELIDYPKDEDFNGQEGIEKLNSLLREQNDQEFAGEEAAVEILLSYFRRDAQSSFYHNHFISSDTKAQRLEMLSCVCEFLAGYKAYRFDTNRERFFIGNDGLPPEHKRWRWVYDINDDNLRKMEHRLKGPLTAFYLEIQRRSSANKINKYEAIGMMRVGYHTELLIDHYRTLCHLIQNDEKGSGLGIEMYTKLNAYRRMGSGYGYYEHHE